MPRIFISYRRADSRVLTERIHDHLSTYFGSDNVFQDVDNIRLGDDFRKSISDYINQSDVILVIIGSSWASSLLEQQNSAADWVRIEVEIALKLGKRIIPTLIMDTRMPSTQELPESVRDICWLNAAQVRANPHFKDDIEVLISHISNNGRWDAKPALDPSDVKNVIPEPFEWIPVKGGTVTIKNGRWEEKQKRKGLFGNEKYWEYQSRRDETEYVDSFLIAKHMITNAQFQKFVDASDGYKHDCSWSGSTWHLNNPLLVTSSSVKSSEFKVNVNYLEATAFCWWLTMKVNYGSWDAFPFDRKGLRFLFWLPAEDEWQRAMKENSIDKRTSSQLWEWTQTSAEFVDTDVLDQNESIMVVRGGTRPYHVSSYDDISRSFLYAEDRNRETGFRIKCKIQ